MSDSRKTIINRVLSYVDNTYSKNVGEFIYDVIAAAAIEFEKSYKDIDDIILKVFAATATAKNLDKKVNEVGLKRKLAVTSSGIVTIGGVIGTKIKTGDLVASDSLTFEIMEDTQIPESGSVDVKVKCQTSGSAGNVPIGAIKYFPVTISGLQTVINKEAFENGYDEENDDELRERFFVKVQTPSTSGNIYDYYNWALEVEGVGGAKVFPLWNGNGTVKVVIASADKKSVSDTLIESTYNYIEKNRPIGATVTVVSAMEKEFSITADISIANGYTALEIQETLNQIIKEYLKDVAFKATYISLARVGSMLLDIDGVLDYDNLCLNNSEENLQLANDEIAVLGDITLKVVN